MTTDKVAPRLALWAGIGYKTHLKQHLSQLDAVSRVIEYAGGERQQALDPTRPDFKVILRDGSVVYVNGKLDASDRGSLAIKRTQWDGFLKRAVEAGAYLFLVTSSPSRASYHAVSPAAMSDFLKTSVVQLEGGPGLATNYTAEPTIDWMLGAIVAQSDAEERA